MGTCYIIVIMNVTGRKKLDEFSKRHADARSAIAAWYYEVLYAEWRTPIEIKEKYLSVSFLGNNKICFNIKGNNYRLIAIVEFSFGIVHVEWIGTHAEYSKKSF